MSDNKKSDIVLNDANFEDSHQKRNNEFIKNFIEMGKKKLRDTKNVNPVSLLICYNIKKNEYLDIIIPMEGIIDELSVESSSVIIRNLISKLEENSSIKILNYVFMMSSQIRKFSSQDYSKIKDGIEKNFTQEELDSLETKNVLMVSIEDQFKVRNVCYEYVEFSDGEIVLNDKPSIDVTSTYDQKLANMGLFNFMLTKGASSN